VTTDGPEDDPLTGGRAAAFREGGLAVKFAGVSLIGFATDAVLLHIGIASGIEPAWSRVISLICAMQVTFIINGLGVFRSLDRKHWPRQWARYMLSNGFGNFCNYWIFVTLVSTHWRIVADPMVALCCGAFTAWMINYCGARFFVFGKVKDVLATVLRKPA